MLLTPEQIHEIRQIIEDHHTAFIVSAIGKGAVPPEVVETLKAKGLIGPEINSITEAYSYGQLVAMMETNKVANMSYSEFKQHVAKNPIPLSAVEQGAMQMAVLHAGQYCRGLGNKVNTATGAILIEADQQLRARTEKEIRTATALNIAKRETVQKLKSDLGWATKDWARDWKRIAVTEKQTAMQHGVADHYRKRHGPDVLVAKRRMPDSCQHCRRLYEGPDGHPRIFKLSVLEGNGTNVGKKAADWQAVVGTTHPNCQCQLIRIPPGWGFNEESEMVPGGEFGQVYEDEADLALALMQEDDLQKAFKLQGHVLFQGIPIAIENKDGSTRRWTDADGNTGETRMRGVSYGYVKGTVGADEDEIDVFIGPDPRAENVYVIDQQNPGTGIYDEQKCMLGFANQRLAEQAYRQHYDNPENFFMAIQPMSVEQFKRWIASTKPVEGTMMKGGPFIGPKGGKWADAAHTIPWKAVETKKEKGFNPAKGLAYAKETAHLVVQSAAKHISHMMTKVMEQKQINDYRLSAAMGSWEDRAEGSGPLYQSMISRAEEYFTEATKSAVSGKGMGDVDLIDENQFISDVINPALKEAFSSIESKYRGFGPKSYTMRTKKLPDSIPWHDVMYTRERPIRRWRQEQRKVQKSEMALVIPLEKSGGQPPANAAAGDRGVGPGVGVNFYIPVPERDKKTKKKKAKPTVEAQDLIQDKVEGVQGALHVDKKVYEYQEPVIVVRPIEPKQDVIGQQDGITEIAERNMEYVKTIPEQNKRRPKNTVDVKRTPVR